jgi:hypothetical protein
VASTLLNLFPVKDYPPRFGKVAVQLGFITAEQLKAALMEQVDDDLADRPHRNLGAILYEKGWVTLGQLHAVMNRIMEAQKPAAAEIRPPA